MLRFARAAPYGPTPKTTGTQQIKHLQCQYNRKHMCDGGKNRCVFPLRWCGCLQKKNINYLYIRIYVRAQQHLMNNIEVYISQLRRPKFICVYYIQKEFLAYTYLYTQDVQIFWFFSCYGTSMFKEGVVSLNPCELMCEAVLNVRNLGRRNGIQAPENRIEFPRL